MDQYQSFIHKSRYARWKEAQKRRETWEETITRYISFWQERGQLNEEDAAELHAAIVAMEVMPSMRCHDCGRGSQTRQRSRI